jgi:rhomboid protease GluP
LSATPSDTGPAPADQLFGRLLAALVGRPSAATEATLIAYQPPLAVAETLDGSSGIVVLDFGSGALATADELRRRLGRILEAHQAGVLIVVVTRGGPEVRSALVEVDRVAPDQKRLGMYHLDDSGRLERVAGRRSAALDAAAGLLGSVKPLADGDAPALLARGQRDREEAARFAAALRGRYPVVTIALIAACVGLYALAVKWTAASWGETLLAMGANSAPAVRAGELWRLLSSAFLHGSITHLLVNMLAIQSFGGLMEAVLGWRRYLILYAAAALGGSLASALAGTSLSVGASGALWGLMAAGFALVRPHHELFPKRIASQLRQRLVVVLLLNIVISFLPGIDFYAHFGGGLVGFGLAAAGLLTPRAAAGAPHGEPVQVRLLAVLVAGLMVAAVAIALLSGRPWAGAPLPELALTVSAWAAAFR